MITKEEVYKLKSKDILKRDYDKIIDKISRRTQEVWEYICFLQNRTMDWWAFSNDVEYADGDGSSGGNFDVKNDFKYISIGGENSPGYYSKAGWSLESRKYTYEYGFPTELLWDKNWKKTIQKFVDEERNIIENYNKKEKDKKLTKKEKRQKLAENIRSKLTRDEIKFIMTKFTKAEEKILLS